MNNSYADGKRCRRCKKPTFTGIVCSQCRSIATLIVESAAMNLAMMPIEALADAEIHDDIRNAVSAARQSFVTSRGVTPDVIEKLKAKMEDSVLDAEKES